MLRIVFGLALICSCNAVPSREKLVTRKSQVGETMKMPKIMRADVDLDREQDFDEGKPIHPTVMTVNPSGHFQVTRGKAASNYVSAKSAFSYFGNRLQPVRKARKRSRRRGAGDLECDVAFSVPGVAEDAECPENCPYLAEDVSNSSAVCRFKCVGEGQCASTNPDTTIADEEEMVCRSCSVEACEECLHNGEDVCNTCAPGWDLKEDGTCFQRGGEGKMAAAIITLIIMFFISVYCCQLCCRKNVNDDAAKRGIRDRWRSRNKPRAEDIVPEDGAISASVDPRAKVWPITTNLCRTPVAGPGALLYFNFQLVIIIWAVLVILAYCVMASVIDSDLFTLGIRDADSSRDMCQNVNWGHSKQVKYMYAKVLFMAGCYVVTFFIVIIHATLQFRRFQDVDDSTTMKDYCAYCTGLPSFHGSELAEERIKQVIEAATGEKVIGVSICWDWGKDKHKVMKTLEFDMCEMDQANLRRLEQRRLDQNAAQARRNSPRARREEDADGQEGALEADGREVQAPRQKGVIDRFFHKIDDAVIWLLFGWEQDDDPDVDELALVKGMKSYTKAFVVFGDEKSRDAAVTSCKRMPNGIAFEGGHYAKLFKQNHEPESVHWRSFGYSTRYFLIRLAWGLLMVGAGLAVWAVAVYVPYAYYFLSYPYAQGDEPSVEIQVAFAFAVTAGNEALYLLVGGVCSWIGFRYKDGENTAYLLIYTSACFLCAVLDLCISCYMVFTQLKKSSAFNANGVMIVDLSTWKSVFESYPMQKALGWELFIFAFPACNLAPYVLEPFLFVWMPYWTGWALVKSRDDLNATMSEKCLSFTQDLEPNARYADLILNMMLSIIMLLFPPGYLLISFVCLLVSHLYIYWWDHWQTLRATRNNYFASNSMDVSASAFLCVPLGLLLCAIIFKFHCIPGKFEDVGAAYITAYCVLAFIGHCVIHVLIIIYAVPKLGKRGHIRSQLGYPEGAKRYPCNWFTANPVHCLRSRYLYKHKIPCQLFVEGKENLIRANPEIGVYYQEEEDDWLPPDSDDDDPMEEKDPMGSGSAESMSTPLMAEPVDEVRAAFRGDTFFDDVHLGTSAPSGSAPSGLGGAAAASAPSGLGGAAAASTDDVDAP